MLYDVTRVSKYSTTPNARNWLHEGQTSAELQRGIMDVQRGYLYYYFVPHLISCFLLLSFVRERLFLERIMLVVYCTERKKKWYNSIRLKTLQFKALIFTREMQPLVDRFRFSLWILFPREWERNRRYLYFPSIDWESRFSEWLRYRFVTETYR